MENAKTMQQSNHTYTAIDFLQDFWKHNFQQSVYARE